MNVQFSFVILAVNIGQVLNICPRSNVYPCFV